MQTLKQAGWQVGVSGVEIVLLEFELKIYRGARYGLARHYNDGTVYLRTIHNNVGGQRYS
jgi:hypothetical protein